MESNKDEAERCISIALKAIQSNQTERALRFLEKAQRLYPTPRASEEGLLYRARYFGDTDMYHRAQKMGTPSCSRLSEVQASLHG
ncbi:DnaJ-like protein subfamily B member 12 [Microtus ochrogaster]|uniref:DnaJ-like protein subfamily B member 12 n=1 Tax=Microtus ochrogaster TaxID=79684 RepID=A0A8J6L6X6_MICOH|nr:DnaJ-like protein subfamily B member 12 [Microtus ochrogaster]